MSQIDQDPDLDGDSSGLFVDYQVYARRVATGIARNSCIDPDEVLSEADSALWRAARSFDSSRGDFKGYAGTAVRNAIYSLLSKAQVDRQRMIFIEDQNWRAGDLDENEDGTPDILDSSMDTFIAVRRRDRIGFVEELLKSCSEAEATAASLFANGQSFSEIGVAMGVSKTMAHKYCQSAFARMKAKALEKKVYSIGVCEEGPSYGRGYGEPFSSSLPDVLRAALKNGWSQPWVPPR